jgi:hypothetical protein
VPDLTASSLSLSMASISARGGGPEFSGCLTNIMNFIVMSPSYSWVGLSCPNNFDYWNRSLHLHIERDEEKSTRIDNYFLDHTMFPAS